LGVVVVIFCCWVSRPHIKAFAANGRVLLGAANDFDLLFVRGARSEGRVVAAHHADGNKLGE
jgi:hypothetical protein